MVGYQVLGKNYTTCTIWLNEEDAKKYRDKLAQINDDYDWWIMTCEIREGDK